MLRFRDIERLEERAERNPELARMLNAWFLVMREVGLPYQSAFNKLANLIATLLRRDKKKIFEKTMYVKDFFFKRLIWVRFDFIEFGGDVEDVIIYVSLAKSPLRPYRVERVIRKFYRIIRENATAYKFSGKYHVYKVFIGKTTYWKTSNGREMGSRALLREFGIIVFSNIEKFREFMSRHYYRRLQSILDKVRRKVSKPFGKFAIYVYLIQLLTEKLGIELSNEEKAFGSMVEVVEVVR